MVPGCFQYAHDCDIWVLSQVVTSGSLLACCMPVSLSSLPSVLRRSCLHVHDLDTENVWLVLPVTSTYRAWLSYKRHDCKHAVGANV